MVNKTFRSVFFQLGNNTLPETILEHRSIACGFGLGSGSLYISRDLQNKNSLHLNDIQANSKSTNILLEVIRGFEKSNQANLLSLTTSFHLLKRNAAVPLYGSMLSNICSRGEYSPDEMLVPHVNTINVIQVVDVTSSQSVTWIISMETRPFLARRGLCTNPAPSTPPEE